MLFTRIQSNDACVAELKDAVTKLTEGQQQSMRMTDMPELLDSNYLRSLLDDIAGRMLKVPNALDRELKCDRLVAGYCNLQAALEQVKSSEMAAYQCCRTGEMMDLLYDDVADDDDELALPLHTNVTLMRLDDRQKRKDMISARNSKLFVSSPTGSVQVRGF